MENLYTSKTLNYYNGLRRKYLSEHDLQGAINHLKPLLVMIQSLAIKEDHKDYNDCQDLLNRVQKNLNECQSALKEDYARWAKLNEQNITSKQRRYDPFLKRFVEGKPCADKNEYHSKIVSN